MTTYAISPSGDVVLVLSRAEAEGLARCAEEGAEGLLNDLDAQRAGIGTASQVAATRRALAVLRSACNVARAAAPASRLRSRAQRP